MKNIVKYICIVLSLPLLFISCLKDKEIIGPDAPGAVSNVIEFGNIVAPSSGVTSRYPLFIYTFEAIPSVDLVIPIKMVGANGGKSDVKVTIEVDDNLVQKYNADQADNYVVLSTSNYTVSSYEVVIPKGQTSANFVVKLLGTSFDFDNTYALGLRIKTVSEGVVSGNFGEIVMATVPKNLYDGVYTVEDGYIQRYSGPGSPTVGDALNGTMKGNPDVTLSTINFSTVELKNLKWGNNGGSIGGIDNLRLTIDPVTNLVTVFAVGNSTVANIAGKTNKYDPATKTFTLNFDWNQSAAKREVTNLVIKYNKQT